jgi:archaellum component FlaC
VALSSEEEGDPEPGYLRIAFSWARTRAVQMYVDTGTELDPEAIQTEVSELEDEIDQFSTIRKKTTSIKKTANEIDEELDEIEGEVKSRLTDIRTELRSEENS